MKFARVHSHATHICAAIISLTAAAMAEAHPDDAPSKTAVDADQSGSHHGWTDSTGASQRAESDPGAAPGMVPPGAPAPPGMVLPGGPPGMAPPGAPPGIIPPGTILGAPLRVGIASRVDVGLSGTGLDDPYSTALIAIGVIGNVYGPISVTTLLNASVDERDPSGAVTLLDGIVRLEPVEALNLWIGRMNVPVDRSGLAGPSFSSPWILRGLGYVDAQRPLPRAGFLGRSDGPTLWGNLFKARLRYYAGTFDLLVPEQSPLFAGRISLALLDPEPGYLSPSSYFGKDILSIGVGGQSKKNGSVNPMTQARSDFTEYNIDLLFEKNLGSAGVIDLEGAYYKFDGDFERTSWSWFGLASYVLPFQIEGARFQPLVRVQQALPTAPDAPTSTLLDAQLGIILNGHFARLALGYRRAYAGRLEVPTMFFGLSLLRL